MNNIFKHELGIEVEDIITGFKGLIICRTEWLTGCPRYSVQPKMGKDGKIEEARSFDENQLKVTGKGVKIEQSTEQRKNGGPRPEPKKY